MKLDTFFDNFDLMADAPNGVQKLREMILHLAVQGKLVPQDPKDEPASALLEKIKAEREHQIKKQRNKKSNPLHSLQSHEISYELPKSWALVRIGDLLEFEYGKGLPKSSIKESGNVPVYGANGIKRYYKDAYAKGPLIIVGRKGSAGAVNKVHEPCWPLDVTFFIQPSKHLDFEFIFDLLKSLSLEKLAKGIKPGLNRNEVYNLPIGLPPINEQKRIVAKLYELMALCDELESRKQQVSMNCIQLNDVSIHKLLTTREPKKFINHWQRTCDIFDLLYSKPENVTKLRQAILQLAVRGKLVPQDPKDEPASVLLEKIKAEKERLIKEGKIKKPKLFPPIDPNDVPYKLPNGWEWVRLGILCETITKGSSPKWQGVNYVDSTDGILFITSENVGNYYLKLDKAKYVEVKFNKVEPRSILKKNDILMNIVGASIGRTAFFDLEKVANINQAVCLIRMVNPNLFFELKYFLYFFNSQVCIGYMFDKQVDNARPNLSMTNISQFAIPIPPLNEQKRIVAKVDGLMALCDELEARLSKSQKDCDRLIEAAVAEIMAD
jgi:type I restriction enzyme S subunit